MKYALLGALLLMTANCSAPGDAQPAAADKLWGTDAHLAPSTPDAVLRYGEHPRAFAELRLPAGDGPFPLAVIYHGGCWKTGVATQAYMAPLATRWQQQGIATLNVDYREVGDGGGWPGSFQDWAASEKLVEQVAAQYPIDHARVTLAGHSAGGLPALWLAMPQGEDGPAGVREPLAVRAAIVFDGQGDVALDQAAFDGLCGFPSVEPFMGGAHDRMPERYAAIAPATHAPQLAQVLFVQAVLPPPADAAQAAIRAGGAQLDVRANPGASHFDIITPGSPVYAANESAIMAVLRGE